MKATGRQTFFRAFAPAAIALAALLAAGPAAASGKCGRGIFSACGLTSPGLYSGSIRSGGDTTFYRFYAQRGTVVHMTLVDAGPAEPCAISISCGQMEGYVHDLHSPHHPLSYVTPVVGFNALDQQAPSTSFTVRLPVTGAYVWSVGGEPSMDEFGRDVPEPYRFSITVDPGDSQVLPTPPTVVRAPGDRVSLPAWEHAIVRAAWSGGSCMCTAGSAEAG